MRTTLLLAAAFVVLGAAEVQGAAPIVLRVDARDVSRRVLHATLQIPAQPGALTLIYPKWIPGEHGPSGPIADLAGLTMTAGGQRIPWRRDPLDHHAFLLDVPAHANTVEVFLDFLMPTDPEGFTQAASSSANLVVISWNTVLLYPKGAAASAILFSPSLRLPPKWKFASALTRAGASRAADDVEFSQVTLETLIDSPLAAGLHLRTFDLSPGAPVPHRLNVVADSAAALELAPADLECFTKLVVEGYALFGARHYRKYDFLLALSDQIANFGLEHHESSDNRTPERMLIDADLRKHWAGLLPHEMVHSWNGKHRRPADLATPDYHQPMKSELLWVYEGLTTYLGDVLTARCGLWTTNDYLEFIALTAAQLEHRRGRDWRPLADTAVATHLLYYVRPEGASRRRGVDYYEEGELIWLEADVLIRQRTQGKRSLDDFCRRFFGGKGGSPRVVSYTLGEVLTALNEVAPYDWRGFFQERVYAVASRPPLGGIEGGGWRLVYRDTPSSMLSNFEYGTDGTDFSFSIGLSLDSDGDVLDVIPGLPADRAGVGPGMRLVAVNQRRWKPELLRVAIQEAKEGPPVELLVENGDFFRTCRLDYRGGARYPHLERDASKPDLLSEIIKPRVQ